MAVKEWWASRAARRHMWEKHGVTWDEVEEILVQKPDLKRTRTVRGERRYFVKGRTQGGRRLTVVFALEGSVARVVTAYDTPTR